MSYPTKRAAQSNYSALYLENLIHSLYYRQYLIYIRCKIHKDQGCPFHVFQVVAGSMVTLIGLLRYLTSFLAFIPAILKPKNSFVFIYPLTGMRST